MKIHVVKPGETLRKIAKKYRIDAEKLQAVNRHIKDPLNIPPRTKVKIPTAGVPLKAGTSLQTKVSPVKGKASQAEKQEQQEVVTSETDLTGERSESYRSQVNDEESISSYTGAPHSGFAYSYPPRGSFPYPMMPLPSWPQHPHHVQHHHLHYPEHHPVNMMPAPMMYRGSMQFPASGAMPGHMPSPMVFPMGMGAPIVPMQGSSFPGVIPGHMTSYNYHDPVYQASPMQSMYEDPQLWDSSLDSRYREESLWEGDEES